MNAQNKEWLIKIGSDQERYKLRLVCFPFAGGGVSNYAKWRNDLHEDIELLALNLPGRERFFGQPSLTDYKELILILADQLSSKTECPMIFFGHSFGALTAYFTALELDLKHFNNLRHVYLSARLPPLTEDTDGFSDLPEEEFKSVVLERYQGIPQPILNSPDLMKLFIPIIHNDFKLYEQYSQVMKSYKNQAIKCAITSIGYSEDRIKEPDFVAWKNYTEKTHHHLQLPGGHFQLLHDWIQVVDLFNLSLAVESPPDI